jgi:hypothetical protein
VPDAGEDVLKKRLLRYGVYGAPVLGVIAVLALALAGPSQTAKPEPGFHPAIPKTWDDAAMATLEVPLANPVGSPKHVPASYYYRIPVRPIYKSYPIYAPGHEPPGYMNWLRRQEPVIVWDDKGHRPPLVTQGDWLKAGEMVFGAPGQYGGVLQLSQARSPEWWAKVRPWTAKDGTLPGYSYVVAKKGEVKVGDLSCASCHTRVMPDGTVVKGAQGNFPFDRNAAVSLLEAEVSTPSEVAHFAGLVEYYLFGAPWLKADPQARLLQMSVDEIASAHAAPSRQASSLAIAQALFIPSRCPTSSALRAVITLTAPVCSSIARSLT